jgi:hypothetical protein
MHSKDDIVAAAQAEAKRTGARTLSLAEFRRATGIDGRWVYRHFDSWSELCAAAGLESTARKQRIPDAAIFADMRDAFVAHARIVPRDKFLRGVPYSANVVDRHFGSWRGALAAFADWVKTNAPDFPLGPELAARLASRAAPRAPAARDYWPSMGAPACGAPLGFRALMHAPTNEAGVVLAFGMVAEELGFAVDALSTGFPDCFAKRRVGAARWEPVRIEFEYKSRNFHDHAHDPAGCDLIVCWEHDWAGAPVEVLELRAAVARLGRDDNGAAMRSPHPSTSSG